MKEIKIASRVVLICTDVFGIFSICELLKPMLSNHTVYLVIFVVLVVMSLGSIIDWDTSTAGRKK